MWWVLLLMTVGPLVVFGLFWLGLYTVHYLRSSDFRSYIRLVHGESTPIDQLEENQSSKVLGVVRCLGEPLRAPLSGRECVYYAVGLERRSEISGPGKKTREIVWHGKDHDVEKIDFLVVDDSGLARVDVRRSHIQAVPDRFVSALDGPEAAARVKRFMDEHGIDRWRDDLAEGNVRLREAVLQVRETIVVYGIVGAAEPHRDPDLAGLRELPMRPCSTAARSSPWPSPTTST